MKKTILITTDFSKNAWDAIIYALELYKDIPCDFYFLNTYNFPGYLSDSTFVSMPSDEVYKEFRNLSESKLKETIKTVQYRFQNENHSFYSVSEHNTLFYALEEFVNSKKVDLIVMGTKGDTNGIDVLFGSNAVNIMENLENCPVLVIPEMVKFTTPKEIVFSTDFKSIDDLKKLDTIKEIAKINHSKICVVHVNTEESLTTAQQENRNSLTTYLDDLDFEIRYLSNNTLFNAISCFTQSRGSDMVTFLSKRHGFLQNIFTKPFVKNIGQRSKIPVLVLR